MTKKKTTLPKKRFLVLQKKNTRETTISLPVTLEYAREIADYHSTKEVRRGVTYVIRELSLEELNAQLSLYEKTDVASRAK